MSKTLCHLEYFVWHRFFRSFLLVTETFNHIFTGKSLSTISIAITFSVFFIHILNFTKNVGSYQHQTLYENALKSYILQMSITLRLIPIEISKKLKIEDPFLHASHCKDACERFIYSHHRSAYSAAGTDIVKIVYRFFRPQPGCH